MRLRRKRIKVRHPRSKKKILLNIGLVFLPFIIGGAVFATYYYKDLWLPYLGVKKDMTIIKPVVASDSTIELERALSKDGFTYDEIKKSTGSARLYTTLSDGPTVVFSDSKDAQAQITSLQLILTHLTIEQGKKAKIIDLRFNKPIVKF